MIANDAWYSKISDRKLRTCFDEINEFETTGVLPGNSLTRQLWREYVAENPQFNNYISDPRLACEKIISEMASRFRHQKVHFVKEN